MNRRNGENDMQPSVRMRGDIFIKQAQREPDFPPGLSRSYLGASEARAGRRESSCAGVSTPSGMLYVAFNKPPMLVTYDSSEWTQLYWQLCHSYHNTSSVSGQRGGTVLAGSVFESPGVQERFCVEFVCSSRACVGFLSFLAASHSQRHAFEGKAKLERLNRAWVWMRVLMVVCVGPATSWWLVTRVSKHNYIDVDT